MVLMGLQLVILSTPEISYENCRNFRNTEVFFEIEVFFREG